MSTHRWRQRTWGWLALVLTGCQNFAGLEPSHGAHLIPPRGPVRAGEIMLAWREAPDESTVVSAAQAVQATVLARHHDRALIKLRHGDVNAACRALRQLPGVRVAEPNRIVRSAQKGPLRPVVALNRATPDPRRSRRGLQAIPNDEAFQRQSPVNGVAATWGLQAIRAEAAWDVTSGDPRIIVAVIDTGIDMTHPDLAANIDARGARNFVEPGQPPDDDFGHGTHVAGIVAAVGDNAQGACGVAYRARILPIRVLGVDGTGTTWNTVTAIDYALEQQASVINLSLGSPDYSALEAEAVSRARAAGALVVAAAGNEAGDGNYLEYPASYEGVVSVAAVGPDLKRALFSNYNSWVTLAAPGVDIFSTIPERFSPGIPYGYLSGTSMAAPMVAGAAALLFSQYPRWTPAQVQERLRRTVRDIATPSDPVPGFDVFHGAGLIDVGRALGR